MRVQIEIIFLYNAPSINDGGLTQKLPRNAKFHNTTVSQHTQMVVIPVTLTSRE